MIRDSRSRTWALVFALGLLAAPEAHAVPLVGALNITGSLRITSTDVDFYPLGMGDGVFAVDPFTQQGSFVVVAGSTGSVGDLDSAAQPTGVPFSLPLWLEFAALPGASFTLEFIAPGAFGAAACFVAPAAGQTCTPVGSPFSLSNLTASSSVLSFAVSGTAVGNGGEETAFSGIFTTQFAGLSYQAVLANLSSGGFVDSTYSASFSVVPEPSSIALLLTGAALLAAGARRAGEPCA